MSPSDYELIEQGYDPPVDPIAALYARVAQLEAALKPFAAVAEDEDNPPFWDETPKTEFADDDEYWSVFYQGLRAKHFRAARAALKDAPQ